MSLMDRLDSPPPFDDQEVARLRVPPHSIEAETSVLGGLLLDNAAFDRCGDVLIEDDFFRIEHRLIYRAIAVLVNSAKPADVITVFELLQSQGKADESGGLAYLNALAQSVPSAANIRRHAEIVREKAMLRKMIVAADETATAGFNTKGEGAAVLIDQAATRFADLVGGTARHLPVPMEQIMVERIDNMNAVHEGSVTITRWSTGISDMDDALLGGLSPGRVYILAARPNVGKTSLALAIAKALGVDQGIPVLFCSQEMPKEECAERLQANVGGIDYECIQKCQLNDIEWGQYSEAVEVLAKSPIWVDEDTGLTFAQFRAKVVSLRAAGIKVVFLDYLTLCDFEQSKNDTRDQAIGNFTRRMKQMAKELKIAIVVLSQLNRAVDGRANPRPNMSDLRESGNIEQDADIIMFLWAVRLWTDRSIMALGFSKNRQGKFKGDMPLEFQGKYQRWFPSEADLTPIKAEGKQKGYD